MEAACSVGDVVAIQGEDGQFTIIKIEPKDPNGSVCLGTSDQAENIPAEIQTVDVEEMTHPVIHVTQDNNHLHESSADMHLNAAELEASRDHNGSRISWNYHFQALNEASVQANDYEIERATGTLPARKRFIPVKFRDFRSPEEISENEDDDSDYEPEPLPIPQRKRRGRPRKHLEGEAGDNAGPSIVKKPKMIKTANGYKCTTCNRVFSQKGNLKVHLITHTDIRPFPCDFENCNKHFRTRESLRRHKLAHLGIKPFECDVCKKKFCSALSLQEHKSRHTEAKPYSCNICQRAFRQISCLRRHLMTHTQEMRYTCEICERKFTQAIYLRSHMKVHTGERPYSCEQCNKLFAHASDLQRHRIIHTGKKPYACSVCGIRFSDPSSRRRHEKEHVGSKPYCCHLCSEGFKRAGQLRAHLFRHHGGLKEGVEFQIQEGSEPVCYRIELREETAGGLEADPASATRALDWSAFDEKKIVSLIQNLNHDIVVQEVEVPASSVREGVEAEHMEEVVVAEGHASVDMEQMVIPVEVATVVEAGEEAGEKLITIAEVEAGSEGEIESYQILQGISTDVDSLAQEMIAVHYHQPPSTLGNESCLAPTTVVSALAGTSVAAGTMLSTMASPQANAQKSKTTATSTSVSDLTSNTVVAATSDYINKPDFGSQEYYNWLSSFTEVCKLVPMPLDVELFQKISQLHKTLSDFMASPSGVISDKENFCILMSISKDLNHILNEHLSFMLQNLSDGHLAATGI
ncbi:zinc finger and BTB domain-containing protein 24-like isoform X3 [Pomacea canaliculata]|uniref:zinc finger and BTB domain-containing protein 24-like isoform X3 n=1 Tax=Pomacea canaliculata TaxID=400727 RepID=UPI000D738ECA|nr:zinc finger and BTB domain-containing protein 24-like isoform X3 [Pomacea canaliculata]